MSAEKMIGSFCLQITLFRVLGNTFTNLYSGEAYTNMTNNNYLFCIGKKGGKSMKCPYCGIEMKQGKICSNDALWWKQKTGDNMVLNDEGFLVGMLNGYRITGFQCETCKKIIIDTSNCINSF